MKTPAPRILMVGTALEGRGGVAAAVSVLRQHGLFAREGVLPNAVPLPPPSGLLPEPGRILFLGRLDRAKGVFDLLAAGALLAPRFPALRLVFGGEGDAVALRRRALDLGIGDRLELPGWLGPRERDEQLARASVFCLPSHAEGLPMAMLEAMAAGRAVIASSVGGIPETIVDGDNGLLVPPHDEPALARALAQVLGDDALRARLARGARATVEQHYSTEVVCGRLSALYRELAGTH